MEVRGAGSRGDPRARAPPTTPCVAGV